MRTSILRRHHTSRSWHAAANTHVRRPPSLVIRASVHSTTSLDSQQAQQPGGWSDWYEFFEAADKLTVGQAVSTAPPDDNLTHALQLLQHAAETEDYENAAKLRDASFAWLGGWWRPVSNPQARGINSSSSLLYVSHRDAQRWTGLLFTPADFMHYDLQGDCNLSELQMEDMLQQARYGTPLFEVFVMPEQQQQQQQQQQQPAVPGDSSAATSNIEVSTSSSYTPVVVALQSVNRAFNELLGVQPPRRRQAPGLQEPKYINQRLLLMVQPHSVTAAAVHAGNDSTLWTWHISADTTNSSSSSSSSSRSSSNATPQPVPAADATHQQQQQQQSAVSGPLRPAELSGGCRSGFTIDWHKIDHLRGPGTLSRTGTDSFNFCRLTLPADVLRALTTISSSSGGGSSWDGSSMRLFRVDLQYVLPPAQLAAAAAPADGGNAEAAAQPGTAAAAAEAGQAGFPPPTDASSSNAPEAGSDSAVAADCQWADRVAAELHSLLSSSSSSSLQQDLSTLLAAAAVGTAPAGGCVSEAQQAVNVTEVPLEGTPAAATAAAAGSTAESAATPAAVEFVRVLEPTAELSFGGWQVTASLT